MAVGLLIGLDREKHKHGGSSLGAAGVRTFTLVALLGAVAALVHSEVVVAVAGVGVALVTALSYRASQATHPGLITEFALFATFCIGYLAVGQVELAAAMGVLITLLISSKSRLHRFAISQLSEQELRDATLLAGAALIVLPLLPDRAVDPLHVVNLRVIWSITILMLSVNALGYVARRMLGASAGLAVAGFCGGFVSSIFTIAAMGRQVRREPALLRAAVAGSAFSSIATSIELLAILLVSGAKLMPRLGLGIVAMGVVTATYGAAFAFTPGSGESTAEAATGRAFEPRFAILFATAFALTVLVAAWLQRLLGPSGAELTVALGGLLDTHAATASAASLAASGTLTASAAAFAALLAITANTVVKAVTALVTGGSRFFLRLGASHAAMLLALWAGWVLAQRVSAQ
jgi:uncharacterized membrane protein (DUF4010 family)